MKCPYCGKHMDAPGAEEKFIPIAVSVIILTCPSCEVILAAVNKPHTAAMALAF